MNDLWKVQSFVEQQQYESERAANQAWHWVFMYFALSLLFRGVRKLRQGRSVKEIGNDVLNYRMGNRPKRAARIFGLLALALIVLFIVVQFLY